MGDSESTVEVPLLREPKKHHERDWEGGWPKSIKYLICSAFCESFTFFGVKAILVLFLLQDLRLSTNSSAEAVHLFIVLSSVSPLLGAVLSDAVLAKYRTILYTCVLYSFGSCILAAGAADAGSIALSRWLTAAGLVLIAVGTGGIKPCMVALGGDQIELNLPEGRVKERLKRQVFALFYFAVHAGAVLSAILTPVLRVRASFAIAFGVTAALMVLSLSSFWAGRKQFVLSPPEGNVIGQVFGVFVDAVKFHLGGKKSPFEADAILAAGEEEVGILGGTEVETGHWLDVAKQTHGNTAVEDVKSLLAVLIVLSPAPLFWSLSDQQSTKWVFQGGEMDRKLPRWIGGFVIEEDQMQALYPFFLLGLIPLFHQVIYPCCEKKGLSVKPIRRMWLGIASSAVAFIVSGFVEMAVVSNESQDSQFGVEGEKICILWQIPQYVVMAAGEVLYMISAVEFAYSQAPESMKSVVVAFCFLSVAGGNIVTVIIFAVVGTSLSQANEYFCFAFLAAIAALVMSWLGSRFVYKCGRQLPDSQEPTEVVTVSTH